MAVWYTPAAIDALPGRFGIAARAWYWRRRLKSSSGLRLGPRCAITGPESVELGDGFAALHACCLYAHDDGYIRIGERASLNSNVIIGAAEHGRIEIGDDVLIGPNVVLRASDHRFDRRDVPIAKQGHTGGTIIVESDVWIASNVVVTKDVRIGRGSVIGAGSVVTADIPPYSLALGVPARVVRECRS